MEINAHDMVKNALAARGSEYRQTGCLEWVYAMAGRPATGLPEGSFLTAKIAAARTIGGLNKDMSRVPLGAVIYWPGDPGHIAISTGNGNAVSTNAYNKVSSHQVVGGKRRAMAVVDERTIAELSASRGAPLGWADDVFNQPLDGLELPKPPSDPVAGAFVVKVGAEGWQVKAWQEGMNRVFPAYKADLKKSLATDGKFGALQSEPWLKEFQRRVGLRVDGWFVWGSGQTWDALVSHGVVK